MYFIITSYYLSYISVLIYLYFVILNKLLYIYETLRETIASI